MSYTQENNELKVLEEKHYYPFGLSHKGYNNVNNQLGYKYKYNGKELQEELNLNIYDYGVRNYDPALGRFFTIDPLADKTLSLYDYVWNNPLNLIDPTGMKGEGWGRDSENVWHYQQGMKQGDKTYRENGYVEFKEDNSYVRGSIGNGDVGTIHLGTGTAMYANETVITDLSQAMKYISYKVSSMIGSIFSDSGSETYPQMTGGDRSWAMGSSHYRFGDTTKENNMMQYLGAIGRGSSPDFMDFLGDALSLGTMGRPILSGTGFISNSSSFSKDGQLSGNEYPIIHYYDSLIIDKHDRFKTLISYPKSKFIYPSDTSKFNQQIKSINNKMKSKYDKS